MSLFVPKPLYEKIARRLKILGDPLRLQLLTHLMLHGESNVTDLVESCGQRQATVSKHLLLLAREGILSRRKEGLNVYYDVKEDLVIHYIYMMLSDQIKKTAAVTHEFVVTTEPE